jgi:DNA-binding transcriptional LysR family regulator
VCTDESRAQIIICRIGPVRETNVIARRIGAVPFVPCAAPSYLRKHGEPQTPRQLLDHECLLYTLGPEHWRFTAPGGKEESVAVTGRLQANNGLLYGRQPLKVAA